MNTLLRSRPVKLLAVLAAFATVASGYAATITYDFTAGSVAASVVGDDAGLLTAGNFTKAGGGDFSSATGTAYLAISATGTTQSAALTDTDYFSFTLTPQVGETLSLSSFTLDFGGSASQVSQGTTFTSNIVIQSSVGGFGSANPTLAVTPASYVSTSATDHQIRLTSAVVDLSGGDFTSLSSSVTFRIMFYYSNVSGGNGNYSYRLDNVALSTASIPEPSSAAIGAGLVVVVAAGLRRRRR